MLLKNWIDYKCIYSGIPASVSVFLVTGHAKSGITFRKNFLFESFAGVKVLDNTSRTEEVYFVLETSLSY